jgi:anti-sigma B factor antagonist
MDLLYSELDNGIRLIKLTGRLDSSGFGKIEPIFTAHCSGDGLRVLVDLSELKFIGSAGIRMLAANARSLSVHGGRIALLTPSEEVKNVLEIAGIPDLIPTYESCESAEAVLLADTSLFIQDRYHTRRFQY